MKKYLHFLLLCTVLCLLYACEGENAAGTVLSDTCQQSVCEQNVDEDQNVDTELQTADGNTEDLLHDLPAFSGSPYTEVNNNIPFFQKKEPAADVFKTFSTFDTLGRCGTAEACLGPETIPTEERGSIGMIRPSGWHTVKYEGIDGDYLYNSTAVI